MFAAATSLVVCKVDRLARSTVALWDVVKRLEAIESVTSVAVNR
jgi:hypothetical protein